MLKNDRLLLRPLQADDAPTLAALANNKRVWDNLRDAMPHPYTEQDARDFIGLVTDQSPALIFAITENGAFRGVIGLRAKADVYRQTAEIGYWLGEPYWGRGIASMAIGLVSDYGLGPLGFVRLEAGVFSHNPASMRVLEKNGYALEGIHHKAVTKNGRLLDEHLFARLAG
ncbi:MAG: GNAT family N-acetyltransferase [Lewinella sp.]|nr:GNAT family N-acetyltransferase [Lewinella sp.]